jgi:hypothetical protein
MKTFETITELQTITRVHHWNCDVCKREIGLDSSTGLAIENDWVDFQEALSFTIECGYGAILGDGNVYTLDMCQQCVQKVLGPYLQLKSDYLTNETFDIAPGGAGDPIDISPGSDF